MIGNPEYNAEAYDITCRICDAWEHENVTPELAGMFLYQHSGVHDTSEIGGAWWALRIVSGYEGTDPGHPDRTSADGWNRHPTLSGGTNR